MQEICFFFMISTSYALQYNTDCTFFMNANLESPFVIQMSFLSNMNGMALLHRNSINQQEERDEVLCDVLYMEKDYNNKLQAIFSLEITLNIMKVSHGKCQ